MMRTREKNPKLRVLLKLYVIKLHTICNLHKKKKLGDSVLKELDEKWNFKR